MKNNPIHMGNGILPLCQALKERKRRDLLHKFIHYLLWFTLILATYTLTSIYNARKSTFASVIGPPPTPYLNQQ